MASIPFVDLNLQYKGLREEFHRSLDKILDSKAFIQGTHAAEFTKDFLKLHGGAHGVGCANGTAAIFLALKALNIKSGDEVLVPNNTFIGSLEPIVDVGATPVLVEIDPKTYTLNWNDLEKKITKRSKALIVVHLYGNPAPMDLVMKIAKSHGLKVIEDCAQAHLARWQDQPVGTFGDLATFSFYPAKNLGALGDAGFVLSQNFDHIAFIGKYLNHGRQDKYLHEFMGGNYRMDGLQALFLQSKLARLTEWTEQRRQLAARYDQALKLQGFKVPPVTAQAYAVYHLYVVETSQRDAVLAHMAQQSIECGIHYPVPMNCQPALRPYGYQEGQFADSERLAHRLLSLPIYPEMTEVQQERVLSEFLRVAKP